MTQLLRANEQRRHFVWRRPVLGQPTRYEIDILRKIERIKSRLVRYGETGFTALLDALHHGSFEGRERKLFLARPRDCSDITSMEQNAVEALEAMSEGLEPGERDALIEAYLQVLIRLRKKAEHDAPPSLTTFDAIRTALKRLHAEDRDPDHAGALRADGLCAVDALPHLYRLWLRVGTCDAHFDAYVRATILELEGRDPDSFCDEASMGNDDLFYARVIKGDPIVGALLGTVEEFYERTGRRQTWIRIVEA